MSGRSYALIVCLLTCAAVTAPGSAAAQAFGKNKVRYDTLDFRVIETAHFDLYHYPSEAQAAQYAARLAESWYTRLASAFDHQFHARQPLVLYASQAHFSQTTIVAGSIPESVGGVTDHAKGRVVLPFAPTLGDTAHVLGHELVHAFQRDILRAERKPMGTLPLWFLEGMAEHLSLAQVDATTAMWIADAIAARRLPTIAQLDDPRYFPYRYGHALWAFLAERFGDDIVIRALTAPATSARQRLIRATGVDLATLSHDWHAYLEARFAPVPRSHGSAASPPAVPVSASGGGRLNLAPAISPDGRFVVFLSEQERYSIDAYLVEIATGRVVRRLLQTATDPRYESLQFLYSSGSWNAAGDRFAFASIRDGRATLSLFRMPDGRLEREIPLETVDAVFSPAWSPDGRRLALSAMRGGWSDLYVFDIEPRRLRRITTDPYGDLQPSWSPDGRALVFATERFTTSLERLDIGELRLGIVDIDTGTVRALPVFTGAQVAPQWSADGASIYFLGDDDGARNVYRLSLADGTFFQVTDITSGGVSGLGLSSPALSLARDGRTMAYALFRRSGYHVYVQPIAPGAELEIRPSESAHVRGVVSDGEMLPGPDGGLLDHETNAAGAGSPVPASLQAIEPRNGPSGQNDEFPVRGYRGRLGFERIGDPYLSAGGGYGSFFRAGLSMGFADLLGQQTWRTALQVGRRTTDLGFRSSYVNRRSRWTWGASAQQLGALVRHVETRVEVNGPGVETSVRTTTEDLSQIHRGASAMAAYPVHRALRLEFGAGLHAVSFLTERHDVRYSRSGTLLGDTRERLDSARAIWFAQPSLALVYDSAALGGTSPALGRRLRFDVAPSLGGLRLTNVAADWREYSNWTRPWTTALRLRHSGRVGPDAGDPRVLPLVMSVRDVARGYTARRLRAADCPSGGTGCFPFRLHDLRHVVTANVELRAPLLKVLARRRGAGPLPLDAFVFADTAALWREAAQQSGVTSTRWLASAGAGVRVNAAGFVFEIAAARPLTVIPPGWRVVFDVGPGF